MDTDQQQLIQKGQEDDRVAAILLFGSQARNEPARDTDVCLVAATEEREEQLQLLDDYIKALSPYYDISVFQQLPLYIRIQVLREATILVCTDSEYLYQVANRTVQDYRDFEPRYRTYLEAIVHD